MLARVDGRVALVRGAIPGERVVAAVERVQRGVIWADVVEVLEPSADRREPPHPIGCGGSLYAHVRYDRQRQLKAEIIADAFRRIGKIAWDSPIDVRPSPEQGYRLRARLHVHNRRAGFLIEGTHRLCDAAPTGQLTPHSLAAVGAALTAIGADAARQCAAIVVAENVAATDRVLYLEPEPGGRLVIDRRDVEDIAGITGVTLATSEGTRELAGRPSVTDTAAQLFGDDPPIDPGVTWSRHAASFFQGNRFLVGALVRRVLELADGDRIGDLYAGVGLFSVALASAGHHVIAVEGDAQAAADLAANAAPWRSHLSAAAASVERAVSQPPPFALDAVVVDPPRTGMSSEALAGMLSWLPPTLVYVSCDPPTLARDAARIVASGYRLKSLDAFDLFPNTPHVETVAVFAATRAASA